MFRDDSDGTHAYDDNHIVLLLADRGLLARTDQQPGRFLSHPSLPRLGARRSIDLSWWADAPRHEMGLPMLSVFSRGPRGWADVPRPAIGLSVRGFLNKVESELRVPCLVGRRASPCDESLLARH